jgi:sigma-E factor negative regulatory protein RseA
MSEAPMSSTPFTSVPSQSLAEAVEASTVAAAVDGDAQALDAVLAAWSRDPSVRERWHAYHWIGDALRSADHAAPMARDRELLTRVREAMAQEPVVLAPGAAGGAGPSRDGVRLRRPGGWMGMAAAASVLAVVGVVVMQQAASPGPAGATSVAAVPVPVAVPGPVPVSAAAPVATPGAPSGGEAAPPALMIRSAELDRYLAAHKQFATTSVVPAPGVEVRSVSHAAPGR